MFPDIDIVTSHFGPDPRKPTGAYEVFYNDEPIWSKLTTGKYPTPTAILQAIAARHGK
ncbi:Hypothetical protein, putative [Bodo saltans]|uniref:Uncharacterized protein n=1 Tax=Bodo saltans TaxID=75058 RepID=A0A0S4IKF3_BODSA|nr:Hypothetical protein, putative [Bodo saltans]|eukprot:CUE63358.1 Hypothetical protein, putative [Bodo saltans]